MKEARLEQITSMLHQYGKVEVMNLCRIFGTTEMTIRRDLTELVNRKIAVRTHGGAMLVSGDMLSEKPKELRAVSNIKEKEAIAKEAVSLLQDGQVVFFDSSTSVLQLARLLTNEHKLLVVTDTISTALELNSRVNIQVICIGGELRKNTCSCHGMFAEQMLSSMHFDIAFLSVPKVSITGVLSTPNSVEVSIKKQAMQRASKVALLVDHSKFSDPDFLEQGHISDADVIITDSKMPAEFIELCKKEGVATIIADVT